MAETEANASQETKMPVDEPQKVEETETASAPRRSTRISTTASASAASNGTLSKGKKIAPKAAEKRSAEVLAETGAGEVKAGTKKAKIADEGEGLKIGDALPELVLKNEQREEVKVQELAANKKGVVLFLVPKADTPGCTMQACGFRDSSSEFEALDFAVYCLSADAPDKQNKWKDKKKLPFPLLSDPERTFIEKLTGIAKRTVRSHFVFAGGKLVDKRMPVKPVDSPRLALEFIRALETGNTNKLDASEAPDAADVAAASAAATVSVEVAPEQPTAETVENKEAAQPTDVAF